MITDYHVYLETGPYTIEWVKEYLKVAKERGVNDLGFSEHGYRFKQAKTMFTNPSPNRISWRICKDSFRN